MTTDIDCKDLVELVTEYIERTLRAEDVERIDRHLNLCGGCDAFVRQMRLTRETVAAFNVDVLPPATQESALALFRKWKSDLRS